MIKNSIFCVAVALSMTACTSTDLIEEGLESGAAIGFSTNITRALANDNFNKFMVYGGYTSKDVYFPR